MPIAVRRAASASRSSWANPSSKMMAWSVGPARMRATTWPCSSRRATRPVWAVGPTWAARECEWRSPDPRTEGIGALALEASEGYGGAGLRQRVEAAKKVSGEVVFTGIHHRQGPAWVAEGASDIAVVWSTEARYHLQRGGPFDMVAIADADNCCASYAAAVVTGAANIEAAAWFVDHLCGAPGRAVYAAHGFSVPGR